MVLASTGAQSNRFMPVWLFAALLAVFIACSVRAEEPVSKPKPIPNHPQSDDIFAYPEDYFAVQIVAVKTKQQIVDLLKKYDLGDPPYGRMRAAGQNWYVLIYGVYPDYESAMAAMEELPTDIKKLNPWIRSMRGLQHAIRAAQLQNYSN